MSVTQSTQDRNTAAQPTHGRTAQVFYRLFGMFIEPTNGAGWLLHSPGKKQGYIEHDNLAKNNFATDRHRLTNV